MNIQASFKGMEPSKALLSYFEDKLKKYDELLVSATSITVEFRDNISNKGVKMDFELDVNIVLPKAVIRVQESGPDMYAVVDKAQDIIGRRLNRYLDKKENWEGVTPWSDIEATIDNFVYQEPVIEDNYIDYVPKVVMRKKLEDMSPISEAEAIERMELAGDNQILFKNAKTSKFSMIYKNYKSQYCLVEPEV